MGELWIAVAFLRESILLHCILAGRSGSLTADKADTATVHREQCILGNGIEVRKSGKWFKKVSGEETALV